MWTETVRSRYAREGRCYARNPGDAEWRPQCRRANRLGSCGEPTCARSPTRSCPSCGAVACGACCRRAFRHGRRCIGISRRGAIAAYGCRSTIARRWRRARPGDGRPARRPASSTASLRKRRRAAVRAAWTPARRSWAASVISSPTPAGCWSRYCPSRRHPGLRRRACLAGFAPLSVFVAAPHFRRWRLCGSETQGGPRRRGAAAGRGRRARARQPGVPGVAATPGGGADAGMAEPQPAVGQGLRGDCRHGPDMALYRKRPNPAAKADTPEKTITCSETDTYYNSWNAEEMARWKTIAIR